MTSFRSETLEVVYGMQQQPSGYGGAAVSSPASAHQPLDLNPISNSNTPQLRPQVARKAVPVRNPVGGANATAPKPQNAPSNAPVKTVQDSIPRPSNINTNLPNLSSILSSTTQPQIQATQDPPDGWSSAFDADGRVYYLNHIAKQTSWNRPIHVPPALPLGWEERVNPDGRIYYFNIYTQGSSWDRPCGDIERRRSSVISTGTSTRQGSVSTMASGPTSPNSSVLSDTFSPLTSGPTSPIASTFQNPFFPPTSGLPSPTSSIPSDNGMISPGIDWESPQYSTKQSRRRSHFSLSSLSSASSPTMRKLHLHSLPTPHLPSNTPASLRQSVDLSRKGGKIAADYGKKGMKFVVKGAKNPNTRKTIAVGIKGFKIVNGIVKATTGVSLGAEFLPDLDLLPDVILGGGGGGDVGGGNAGDVDVDGGDVVADSIVDGNATDGVDTSAFDMSGVDTSGFDTSVYGADVDSVSVESAEVVTGVYGVGVDTIEVDTVEVDTVEFDSISVDTVDVSTVDVSTVDVNTVYVDTIQVSTVEVDTVEVDTTEMDSIGVDTIEESNVEVDTVDVETIQMDTVQVDTLGVDTVSTCEMDGYIVSSDIIIQENSYYEQVDVGYVEEVDVSVGYIPGTDDDDERRRRHNQQKPHQNNPTHNPPRHPPHHPPHQKPIVGHPQAISPHPKPTMQHHLATKSVAGPAQMDLVDMPAPLEIKRHRKEAPIKIIHEIIHTQVPAAEKEPRSPNENENLETNPSINTEDPKTLNNIQATEISPSIREIPVAAPLENISFPGPHDKSNPSQTDTNEDYTLGFDISSLTGDPFGTRQSSYLAGRLEINEDSTEKEVVPQAPPHVIEKDSVPQPAIHSSCPYFLE